ncbi:MAG: hypothetical protein KIT17_00945 [Rubrivivax sp.]|nr:hypothetical protein [Rubrivivax sp.]
MAKSKQSRRTSQPAPKRDPLQIASWVLSIAVSVAKLVEMIRTRWPF